MQDRTQDFHEALAVDMLYRATIGFALPSHPEMEAFIKGFELKCPNGFKLSKVSLLQQLLNRQFLMFFDHKAQRAYHRWLRTVVKHGVYIPSIGL